MHILPYEHSLAQDILLTKKNAPTHNQGTFVTQITYMYFQGVFATYITCISFSKFTYMHTQSTLATKTSQATCVRIYVMTYLIFLLHQIDTVYILAYSTICVQYGHGFNLLLLGDRQVSLMYHSNCSHFLFNYLQSYYLAFVFLYSS